MTPRALSIKTRIVISIVAVVSVLAAIKNTPMMRIIVTIIISVVLISCKHRNQEHECVKGLMKAAYYQHGMDTAMPQIKDLKVGFVIHVDTNIKAHHFISFCEDFARRRSIDTVEALRFTYDAEKTRLTSKQIERILNKNKAEADSIHRINNSGQQLVWLINNSNDTVILQMQDWLYICILEAIDINKEWRPIEYWCFSRCGNSYYNKKIMPKMANSFVMDIPRNGDYKTKLRFKLLGLDKFYYSNTFDGKINYCCFKEDVSKYEKGMPHFKLEKLINFEIPPPPLK